MLTRDGSLNSTLRSTTDFAETSKVPTFKVGWWNWRSVAETTASRYSNLTTKRHRPLANNGLSLSLENTKRKVEKVESFFALPDRAW